MNNSIVALTFRQMVGRRRVLLLVIGALIPVALAVIFRIADPEDEIPQEFAAHLLFQGLILFVLLPLTALVVGTSVLGGEIEDGTAVYLLSKPIHRGEIIFAKLLVAWVTTAGVVVVAGFISGTVALWGETQDNITAGFLVGIVAGALAYCSLFLLLSIATTRALIAGLVYVFVWEGLVTGLFSGTRSLSVREYSLAIADAIAELPGDGANMSLLQALILLALVCGASTWLAIRRLERYEIGETG
jgi:ABC-2 type transport system permease protein